VSQNPDERKILGELLEVEKHEDTMISSMVKLIETNEMLAERINRLTWIMLVLTWITLIISISNTLATFFGIPKVSEMLKVEIIAASMIISIILPVTVLLFVGSDLRKMLKRSREERTA